MDDHVLCRWPDPSWTTGGPLVSLYCMFVMHTSSFTFLKAILDVFDIGRPLWTKNTCCWSSIIIIIIIIIRFSQLVWPKLSLHCISILRSHVWCYAVQCNVSGCGLISFKLGHFSNFWVGLTHPKLFFPLFLANF